MVVYDLFNVAKGSDSWSVYVIHVFYFKRTFVECFGIYKTIGIALCGLDS